MSAIETIQVPFNVPTNRVFIKQGDTIPKITITLSDTSPFTFIGATIKMQLYRGNQMVFNVGTDVGGITITGARTAEIDQVEKEDNNFPEGSIIGDFEITTSTGERKTYCNMEYHILKQYTK